MSKIYNQKPVSEIQAMRALEKDKTLDEKLGRVMSLLKSDANMNEQAAIEITSAMGEIMNIYNQTVVEITMMISSL